MSGVDITEFLLARIADDEAVVHSREVWVYGSYMDRYGPARVLAECEAKRRIVEGMRPYGPIDDINASEILPLLALPYANHPDYREEWRP